jgi:hypothetical protein
MHTGDLLSQVDMTIVSRELIRHRRVTRVLPVLGAWLQKLKVVATVLNCAKYHESDWRSMGVHIVTPLCADEPYMSVNIGYYLSLYVV